MRKIKIVGTGSYLPERIINNFDLEKMVDTSDEWITERTGIKERHIARPEEATSDLAQIAAKRALEMAGIKPSELDVIIVGTSTPDTIYPSTACWLQKALGTKFSAAFDVSAGCSGFLYALEIAANLISQKTAKKVLVVGAEVMSKVVNWEDRATCVLFGDGAGAAVVVSSEGSSGIISSYWGADGNLAPLLYQPAGGTRLPASEETVKKRLHSVHMEGREVFKHAVIWMGKAAKKVLEEANLTPDDITIFIPHQANMRIIDATLEKVKIPKEKTYLNLPKCGNMSAATIPVALDEANREGKIKDGDYILLTAFGTGFTWAAMVLKW
jgi:3-oxoacyl-[acyl-carrier-protein] synthase-3|uniref:Beta-ketoacyl-[acyl-carrier-protein] synthase III n=1 Tax=candidate division WOR-3 bacterium TaxID=2052148 RepID=A0A7C3YUD1_UNCW3